MPHGCAPLNPLAVENKRPAQPVVVPLSADYNLLDGYR